MCRIWPHKDRCQKSVLSQVQVSVTSLLLFLVNDQRDAQIPFYVFILLFNSLRVLSTSCLSSGETNCIDTTSGSCYSVSVAVSCAGWE